MTQVGADSPERPQIEALTLTQTSARERGRAHGEHWRAAVHTATEIAERHVVARRGGERPELVASMLRALSERTPALHEELLGIAEGADLAPERVLLVNAMADLGTPPPDEPAASVDGSGGTLVYCKGDDGPLLGITLDLVPGLGDSLVVLRLPADAEGPAAWVVTVPGCLGLCGLSATGLAVASLELNLSVGEVGLPWPAVVRRMLRHASAASAVGALTALPLSGGRYWVLTDGTTFHGLESSGARHIRTQTGARAAHLHTNHCFDPVLRQTERIPAQTSTFARLNAASTVYAQQRPKTADAMWAMLHAHDEAGRGLCRHDEGQGSTPVTATVALLQLHPPQLRVAAGCERVAEATQWSMAGT